MKLIIPSSIVLIIALFSCSERNNCRSDGISVVTDDIKAENQRIFDLVKDKDSLLFDIGFNQIDTLQVIDLTSSDFEFYHDEHGITETKSDFVNNISGIRDLPFKTWRTLVEGSMEVFPMYENNSQDLYGAIQNGIHDFYQQNPGEDARKTNTARFTHLWIIENGNWKLRRVLSYDHQIPK